MIAAAGVPARIAALVAADSISGPARQLTALAQALRQQRIECLVVIFRRLTGRASPLARYLDQAGVAHAVVQDNGAGDWRLAGRVRNVLTPWRPSILQTHGAKATAVAYLLRRWNYRLPWVGCFHGATTESFKTRCYHWIDRRLLGAAERVVVMSASQAEAFRHCAARVRVIHNAALATPAGDAAERDRTAAVLGGLRRPRIGVVGRLSPEKGVDVFLDACRVLAREGLSFSAIIVGDGPERQRLEAQCGRLGLGSHVTFAGAVADVSVVYPELDLVVLPSRSEGLPNTLLEALWSDRPVIAAAVGAVPEVLDAPAAGRLVGPNSVLQLAAAMREAITCGDPRGAAAARRAVVERYSLQRRVQAHLDLYGEVLRERAGLAPGEALCAASLAP